MILDIHEDASLEVNEAMAYYDAESWGLGAVFLDEIEAGYDHIVATPLAAEEVDVNIRRLVLAKFPYSLFYEVDGDTALILAVAHQRRRPYYWSSRRRAG